MKKLVLLLGTAALFAACADGSEPADTYGIAATTTNLLEGSADGVGVVRLLNSESTTLERLDIDAGLNFRAAAHLMAYRNGPNDIFENGKGDDNLFTSVQEVDAVRYVGSSTLQDLVDFAASTNYVPGPNDFLGRYDNTPFTVAEAELTVAWVNRVGEDVLEWAGVPLRTVVALEDARPISTIYALAETYWIGPATMRRMKAAALADFERRQQ